jgi:hypothetical protein
MVVYEIIILILGVGIMNVLCFLIGAKTGQKVVKGEEVTLPTINPVKAIETYQEDRRQKKEEENFNINLENIENYDGTGIGQKDFIQ